MNNDLTEYRTHQFEKLAGGNRTYTIVVSDQNGGKTHTLNIDSLELLAIKRLLTGEVTA